MNKKDNKDRLLKDKNFHLEYFIRAVSTYYKSYSHKPHLGALPHDLHTNDPEKLKERLRACNRELKNAQSELKDAREMDKMMEDNIKEIEENEKVFKKDIEKLQEANDKINSTMDEIYGHFEDVTMLTEDDGWEIKKQYDKVKETMPDADFSEIEDTMNEFIDEVSLLGYIPDTYPKDDSIKPVKYIEDKLEPLIDDVRSLGTPEAVQLADQMEAYKNNYDISKDTPLTQELTNIQDKNDWSDLWDRDLQNNEKQIKDITNTIEKENERKEGIKERQKENRREMGKLETKVNDFKNHGEKIKDKLGD